MAEISQFSKNQILQGVLMVTLFCLIYSKPYDKNVTRQLVHIKPENLVVELERQKIILELKSKILSRLNLDHAPKSNPNFNWGDIPNEMKDLLNREVQAEKMKTEHDENRVEMSITQLLRNNSCWRNQSQNRECFRATIPNLDIEEITSAKLLAPLRTDVATAFDNIVQYNLTMNQYRLAFNLQVGTKGKGNAEIEFLDVFKEMITNDDNDHRTFNITSLMISIDGLVTGLPIDQIINVDKIVLEIQYKPAVALKRSKRSANMCQLNQYFCCTQTMKVTVDELGWSKFIVAPKSLTINYCKGDCNNYLQYSSNNAKALNLIKTRDSNERKETRSCCVPYSFSSLTIMYLDSNESLQLATFNDLAASTCGCL